MSNDLLQKAIENYDIDNFKRYWEKTNEKKDYISKNTDERFTALIKDYLNKKIQQTLQKKCSKNCDGKHGIHLSSLQTLYDTYGSSIDHFLVKKLTAKNTALDNEKKHDLTVLHWSLLSYQKKIVNYWRSFMK